MNKQEIIKTIKQRIKLISKQPLSTCRKQTLKLQIAELEWVLTLLG